MREGTTELTSSTPEAESWVGRGARHLALVVQRRDDVGAALAVAARLSDGACLRLSVIGIPVQRPIVNHLAPMSGAISFDQLVEEAAEDACQAARLAALSAPAFAETTYRCIDSWRAPCLLGALRDGVFCALVLSGRPERRSDRRRLAAAAREGGSRMVLVAEATRRVAPSGVLVAPVAARPAI